MRGVRAFFISVFVVIILAWAMSGCSAVEGLANHPVVVRVAVTQAVLRYIDQGDSAEEMMERKAGVLSSLSQTLAYIDSDVNATVDTIVDVFVSQVNFSAMPLADQLLARETIALVQASLRRRIGAGELPENTVLVLRDIVTTAIDAANYL